LIKKRDDINKFR
jgi:rapamycin-insensitive companion of mTOR